MSSVPLGWDHQKRRAAEPFVEGQQCACPGCNKCRPYGRCPVLLWSKAQAELDHIVPRVHGGIDGPVRWLCRACNRSRGATLGNGLRKARKGAGRASVPRSLPRAPRLWDRPSGPTGQRNGVPKPDDARRTRKQDLYLTRFPKNKPNGPASRRHPPAGPPTHRAREINSALCTASPDWPVRRPALPKITTTRGATHD